MTQTATQQTERRPSGKDVKKSLLHRLVGQEVDFFSSGSSCSGKLSCQTTGVSPGFYIEDIQIRVDSIYKIDVNKGTIITHSYTILRCPL